MKTHESEGRFDELVERLKDELEAPSDDELRELARAATAEPRAAVTRRGWPLRPRWTAAAVAASLLLASGLGFGVGSSLTPSGSAGTPFAGLGFLPAKGWTVIQSDTNGPSDAARAIAANVELHPDDTLDTGPARTLERLPRTGVVIQVTFTTRGDPSQDIRFGEVAELPLDLAVARRVPGRAGFEYRLRTGVGGYNLDARIYYGSATPHRMTLRAAQSQLNRLVVASERVTLLARPTVLRGERAATFLYGSIDSRREGEIVTIQARDCGLSVYTGVASARTEAGGSWNVELRPDIKTSVRAVWKGAASSPVTLERVPSVYLDQRAARRFEVGIVAKGQFWRKKALFQRKVGSRWVTMKTVVLTESGSQPGYPYVYTSAEFNAVVPKGSLVRAVLPRSQARPCYLQGASDPVKTT